MCFRQAPNQLTASFIICKNEDKVLSFFAVKIYQVQQDGGFKLESQ